jgi:selenide,water dikinase
LGPEDLDKALKGLDLIDDPNLIVGLEHSDDAGVYKISDDLALIQTIDYFTPIVDDPYTFGQIAAANALSDIYAMGGTPLTAMNMVCFPIQSMDISVLNEILKGGLDKMREAKVTLVGGHSVEDAELKYGLSVTGTIHPEKVITNAGAKVGDKLILTKPLGTGIINTALKAKMASEDSVSKVIQSMITLNKEASEVMQSVGVNSCTDITGFGFLGHACEMVHESAVGMLFYASSIPFFPEAEEYAREGLVPGGTHRNRKFRANQIEMEPTLTPEMIDIIFDPQTSGGLLISVAKEKADELLNQLKKAGIKEAAITGEVVSDPKGKLVVKSN